MIGYRIHDCCVGISLALIKSYGRGSPEIMMVDSRRCTWFFWVTEGLKIRCSDDKLMHKEDRERGRCFQIGIPSSTDITQNVGRMDVTGSGQRLTCCNVT